jgi:hypothetical protein
MLRIPFFFEPNFDSNITVLAAARRLQDVGSKGGSRNTYDPVVYGEFLLKKVGSNFGEEGKGRYD